MDLNPSSSKKLAVEPMKCPIPERDSFTYNLIDDCVNILFDNLPLEDLLHCNLVCRQWYKLYRAACSRRRRLTLIIRNPIDKSLNYGSVRIGIPNGKILPTKDYTIEEMPLRTPYQSVCNASFNSHPFANWDDKLSPIRHSWLTRKYNQFDHRLVPGLMHNLANITSLEIILTDVPSEAIEHVIELLHFWADNLVTLKLWLDYPDYPGFPNIFKINSMQLRLIDAINSLSRLTHLTIHFHTLSIYKIDANKVPILLIQLENLKEFNFRNQHDTAKVCKAICRYAQSHPNLRVGLDTMYIQNEDVELLFSYQVASQFTQLCLCDAVTEPLLTRVCRHFTNLTTLQFTSSILPAAQWTKAIAQCSQLVHLKLDLQMKVEKCPDLRTHPTKQEITQLKFIKMLTIKLFSYSHDDLKTLQFTWIFPNLQMIYLNVWHLRCHTCGTNDHYAYPRIVRNKNPYNQCVKLLLSPLKEFEHLEVIKVYTNSNGTVLYSKDDL